MDSKDSSKLNVPKAVGPYSQSVITDRFVFTSGQLPLDPTTGEIVPGGVELQAARALENIKAILESAGSGMEKIVKTTIYIKNMMDFPEVNKVYAGFFSEPFPARSTVGVADLPRGALIEIEAVAIISD